MPSKEVADLTHDGALTGAEELHLVAGVVRDGGGNVTNHGNSRRATLTELLALVPTAISQAFADGRYLQKAANLSDLASAAAARVNLALGSAATFASTAFLQVANNLSDVANVVTARTNLSVYSKAEVDAAIAGASPTGMPFEAAVIKPAVADFAMQNLAGGTTAATFANYAKGVALLQNGTPGATGQIRFARHNVIGAGVAFTLTGRFESFDPQQANGQANFGCLILRNSANGRMILFGQGSSDASLFAQIFSGYTSGQLGQYTAFSVAYRFPWRRITVDAAGNIVFWASIDGINWVPGAAGTTIANYLGALDEIGMGLQSIAAVATPHGTLCQSLGVTFP